MSFDTSPDERPSRNDTLEILADRIRARWQESDKKSDDERIVLAEMLKEAEERVKAGEDERFKTFKPWCVEELPDRSERDIRRLLRIAHAEDPVAEAERQRQAARDSMATSRARRKADQRWSASSLDDVRRAE